MLLEALGEEIDDPGTESFLLFSQSIPSQNLGFVDSKATLLELTIGDRDLTINQSPTILSSNRGGGTTGAVVWKITPLFARWITSTNFLFKLGILDRESAVLELGCGISGIIGLSLAPLIGSGNDSRKSFDAVIACDCIYNDALISPLVQTCVDACTLRVADDPAKKPAVCIVAQQLRSSEVFEGWLNEFHKAFQVWRLPDEELIAGLKSDSGFVVHVGILR